MSYKEEDIPKKPVKRKARVERILKKKEPQLVEGARHTLILKGHKSSQIVNDVLKNISALQKPYSKVLSRKNEILPFEDINSLEFLATKNDCSIFALGSHSKKRPHNLILGRLFDGHLLDMFEFGIDSFVAIEEFSGPKKAFGSKPVMIFQGDQWEIDSQFTRLQNFLLDFFRSDKIDKISLKGVDHVLVCTVSEGKVYVRGYMVQFKKSGTKVPNAQLVEMGPFLDLSVRRTNLGSDDMWKAACKKPKIVKPTKVKNITSNNFGDKIGQIHMKKQNLDRMGGRRSTALRSGKRNITDTSGSNFNEEDYDEPTTSNPAPKKQKTLSQRNPLADF